MPCACSLSNAFNKHFNMHFALKKKAGLITSKSLETALHENTSIIQITFFVSRLLNQIKITLGTNFQNAFNKSAIVNSITTWELLYASNCLVDNS